MNDSMVYVFGLNIPIVEILLILLVLLAVGLGLVWIELKKLRKLLSMERGVLNQFEQDLNRFESNKGKEHDHELESYVKTALGRGASPEEIKQVLQKRGWDEQTINQVFQSVREKQQ